VNLIHYSERPPLTDQQFAVLYFINTFRSREQCNPTMAEISAHFGWKSINAAHDHCAVMMRKGVLSKRSNRARGYVVNAGWMR
jgi:SOS-response transcriptional repressor LexA